MVTGDEFILIADCLRTLKPQANHDDNQSYFLRGHLSGRRAQWTLTLTTVARCLATMNPEFDSQFWLDYVRREPLI